ncbi:hypothetical protein [Teredinibacter sp. KSP-S5-2]|uniref:hypothetical protein n=1 Tax=Teredinibacter sp. KSP-S5-2 TaxID=3034506 RepID=UPI00293521A4|nr:hypothetical protein [Teredinibacter sp. KSP-S5-2]WNO10623.1 hypothetical protein P5V12_05490 [Teredinibacter sp. KSP-S5-2]
MSLNLYFKSDEFETNKGLADYLYEELKKSGVSVSSPEIDEYMCIIESSINGEVVHIYMGKNEEESSPVLWQVWPEQVVPIMKRLFGKTDRAPEEKAKQLLENVVNHIPGVSSVEWGI